ncbi:MAG: hypothetical protein EA379_01280 [Phycisphaerales bacterium]|nr:MAG: hypothetical protein EA379_01280 [Phycisphaerales bacterium]
MIRASAGNTPSSLQLVAPVGDLVAARGDAKDGEPSPRRFSITAYTGGLMRLFAWEHPVVIDLAGMEIAGKSRPVLKDHRESLIVGHTTKMEVVANELLVDGVVSGAGAVAREVVESSLAGFPWQASVGASADSVEEVAAGATVNVNGREFTGPLYVVRASKLKEISFVALGADDDTAARVAANQRKEANKMGFEAWVKAQGFELESLTDQQRKTLQAAYNAEIEAKKAAGDPPSNAPKDEPKDAPAPQLTATAANTDDIVAKIRADYQAEANRIKDIRAICAGKHDDIEAKAIGEGWGKSQTELEVLRASRPNVNSVRGNSSGSNPMAIEAALCMSAGMNEATAGKHYDEKTMEAATAPGMRGAGLQTLFYDVIAAAGGYARAGKIDNDTIKAAFRADQQLIQASGGAGFSTLSLSGILSNIANKVMLMAYEAVPSVASLIASESDVSDFREVTRFRLTGQGVFEKVAADGELKTAELSEESYKNKIDTYGRMITLTRQMIINDDLGAFLQIPRIIGRMSALKREEALFELLLSNPGSFFAAGNDNFLDGADTALSIDSLTLAEQAFLDQTDSEGKPIMLMPSVLLVPTSLKVRSQQLMTETRVNETTTANLPSPANNPHVGKFTPVASPYLNAQGIAGGTDKAWYLFANPMDVAAIDIAYLRGRRVPTIESGETNFNTLGMQWRGYFDFGIRMQDHRAAVKMKGEN